MGRGRRALQPKTCCQNSWHVAGFDIRHLFKYEAGSALWVKETFAVIPGQPYADGKEDDILVTKADCGPLHAALVSKWKPSIFMPRNLSRITLEITNVRVERLQDISEADAISEGVVPGGRFPMCARGVYADLWDSINGEGSWDKNPWVWVIEFRHER